METTVIDYEEVDQGITELGETLEEFGYDRHLAPDAWMATYEKTDEEQVNRVRFNTLESQIEIESDEYDDLDELLEGEREEYLERFTEDINSMTGNLPKEDN